jgi:hypothetical protein
MAIFSGLIAPLDTAASMSGTGYNPQPFARRQKLPARHTTAPGAALFLEIAFRRPRADWQG